MKDKILILRIALGVVIVAVLATIFLVLRAQPKAGEVKTADHPGANPLATETSLQVTVVENGARSEGHLLVTSPSCPAEIGGVNGIFSCEAQGEITFTDLHFSSNISGKTYPLLTSRDIPYSIPPGKERVFKVTINANQAKIEEWDGATWSAR